MLFRSDIIAFEQNNKFILNVESQECEISTGDVEIISEDIPGWLVANEGNLTVALDITVTENLRNEGLARELVNRIQNLRKNAGLEITDKIRIEISSSEEMDKAVKDYADYIKKQVLAESLNIVESQSDKVELDFEDFKLSVKLEKV